MRGICGQSVRSSVVTHNWYPAIERRRVPMLDGPDPDGVLQRFQYIVNGPALFNAITTAVDLDIFRFLSRSGAASSADLEAFTGLAPHQLRVLMLALCTTGLVRKDRDTYQNSAVGEQLLATDDPAGWARTLTGWRRFQYPAFPELTPALRAGTNTALAAYPGTGTTLYERIAGVAELEKAYHDSIAPFSHLYLPALAEHEEMRTVRHLLDVGGADGTTAAGIAKRYPHARVTIFDFPTVTDHAMRSLGTDFGERVSMHAGNFFTDPFPAGPDTVLFSHVLEPFSAEQNRELMAKALDVLPPGGRILAYGTTAPDEEDGGPLAARLSLFLNVLASGTGMAHPVRDYADWLRQVGCAEVRTYPGLPYEHGLAVGIKG